MLLNIYPALPQSGFQRVHFQDILPECLKLAKTLPLFKRRERNNPEVYKILIMIIYSKKVFEKNTKKGMLIFARRTVSYRDTSADSNPKCQALMLLEKLLCTRGMRLTETQQVRSDVMTSKKSVIHMVTTFVERCSKNLDSDAELIFFNIRCF